MSKRVFVYSLLSLTLAGLLIVVGCKKEKDDDKDVLKDFDGNVYTSVVIGTQEWMKEKLRTTSYRSGDPIASQADGHYLVGQPEQWDYQSDRLHCTPGGQQKNQGAVSPDPQRVTT